MALTLVTGLTAASALVPAAAIAEQADPRPNIILISVDAAPAAEQSAVSTCTTRAPSAARSTRTTRTPGNPNNNVVPWSTPVASLVCCFATVRLQEVTGPHAQTRREGQEPEPCPVKIEEPSQPAIWASMWCIALMCSVCGLNSIVNVGVLHHSHAGVPAANRTSRPWQCA